MRESRAEIASLSQRHSEAERSQAELRRTVQATVDKSAELRQFAVLLAQRVEQAGGFRQAEPERPREAPRKSARRASESASSRENEQSSGPYGAGARTLSPFGAGASPFGAGASPFGSMGGGDANAYASMMPFWWMWPFMWWMMLFARR